MMSTETVVRDRYANAAQAKEDSLCCAVDYDARFLEAIPDEVIERDYGCGDPSRYLREGETVLDLGSGTGKICFIASQVVGPNGCVIGVDMTDEMLELIQRLMDRAPDGSILVVEADQRFEFRQLPDAERWDVRCYPPAVLGIYELKTESGVRV